VTGASRFLIGLVACFGTHDPALFSPAREQCGHLERRNALAASDQERI
jgi:hypothetical protein